MMDVEQIAEAVFKGVESRIERALGPLLERLDALEQIEVPAVPTAAEVAKTILAGDEVATLVDLHVAEAVAKIEPIQGEKGDPGADGKDGIGLAGAIIDRNGELVVTLTNGEAKSLGPVVGRDGQNGADGKDGVSFEHFELSYIPESHEIQIRAMAGTDAKEIRYPAGGIRHGGYWREGTKAVAGETWTDRNIAWIAIKNTLSRPALDSPDWKIFANKGRDGNDGRNGRDLGPPEPVKLRNGDA